MSPPTPPPPPSLTDIREQHALDQQLFDYAAQIGLPPISIPLREAHEHRAALLTRIDALTTALCVAEAERLELAGALCQHVAQLPFGIYRGHILAKRIVASAKAAGRSGAEGGGDG